MKNKYIISSIACIISLLVLPYLLFSQSMSGPKCGGVCSQYKVYGCVRGTASEGDGCAYIDIVCQGNGCKSGFPLTKNGDCTGIGGDCMPDGTIDKDVGYCVSACIYNGRSCYCGYTGASSGKNIISLWKCKD